MNEYKYHLDTRLDGKHYCCIYQHGFPLAITVTDDYDTEEEAIEAAEELIHNHRKKRKKSN